MKINSNCCRGKYIFTLATYAKYFNKLCLLSTYKYLDGKNTMMGNIRKKRKTCRGKHLKKKLCGNQKEEHYEWKYSEGKKIRWGNYSKDKSCGKQNEKEYIEKCTDRENDHEGINLLEIIIVRRGNWILLWLGVSGKLKEIEGRSITIKTIL